jgi:hypothetical protein
VPARFANRGTVRRSTVLVFWLARPGRVVFTVLVEASSCRPLGSFAARGHGGVNRVRYRGRLDGRPLPPGRYTLVPRVYRRGAVTHLERVAIEILPSNAAAPLWRRNTLVPVGCDGDGLAGVWERTTADAGSRLGARPAASHPGPTAGVKGASKTVPPPAVTQAEPSEEDFALQVPFFTDGEGGPPSLVAGVLLAALGFGLTTILLLVVRFLRGSWNP